ncbi:hypothetical protein VDP25_07735 [Winogradskyella sp. ECml5-4]|uniref:hypothetical protein n=1 Tax=Winogradskyella sp. ECml5-4 TaxID=3110975 RepID=UPI002FF23612
MELYLELIAISAIANALGIGKLLQILFLRIIYPKAGIKDLECFIKNTKTKITFPKLWK